jgi:hypothetical protein
MVVTNENQLFLLYSCDANESLGRMILNSIVRGKKMLMAVIANQILKGRMDYAGLSQADGIRAMREDFQKNNVRMDLLKYGYVYAVSRDEIIDCDNTLAENLDAFDLLVADDRCFENLIKEYDNESDNEWDG